MALLRGHLLLLLLPLVLHHVRPYHARLPRLLLLLLRLVRHPCIHVLWRRVVLLGRGVVLLGRCVPHLVWGGVAALLLLVLLELLPILCLLLGLLLLGLLLLQQVLVVVVHGAAPRARRSVPCRGLWPSFTAW